MKVYVVTTGCYSDYTISKVFTDKDKAKEYKEWLYDSNDIEEYDTEDDFEVKKFYKIWIEHTVYDKRNAETMVQIFKYSMESDRYDSFTYYTDYHKYKGDYFRIVLVRFVPAENFNEEFHKNKYTKVAYDLAAIAKQKKSEGYSEEDIQMLFNNMEE